MPNDTNPRLVHGQPTSTRNSTRGFDKHVWPPTEGWPDGVTMQVYDNGRIKIGAKHATIAVDDVSTFRPGPGHHGSAHVGFRFDPADTGTSCTGHQPQPEPRLNEAQTALRDHLIGVARRLDPAADTNTLVGALPGYRAVRDIIDPQQQWFKGPRCYGMGDALRAISAYDDAHGVPRTGALVKRARAYHPAAGWWDTAEEQTWDEMVASWQEAVRAAVDYWHSDELLETTDCQTAVDALPARWRALANMADPIQDAGLIAAWRKSADELEAALPNL